MEFGIVVPVEQSAQARDAGCDFVEEVVLRLLQGEVADNQWTGLRRAADSALPLPAANLLVPGSLKITGPDASLEPLAAYMRTITARAAAVGIKLLVFGSGAARAVPDGFDRKDARRQILDFVRMCMPLCAHHRILLVCEPLCRDQCNIINSIPEAMEYVWQIDHPNFQCLLDSFHFWLENEPIEHLRDAMPWIRHVHVADRADRVAPGESGRDDYRPLFAELKRAGYDGKISVETFDYEPLLRVAPRVLEFLKAQWREA